MEDVEDEDEVATKDKKKKKKKPKKKKKKPTAGEAAAAAAVETPDIEQLSLNTQAPATPAALTSPAPSSTTTLNGTPATPTSPSKAKKKSSAKPAPVRQPASNASATTLPGMSSTSLPLGRTETAQSAHKYLKEEGLLGGKEKVKSRADHGNLASIPEKKRGYWSRFSRRDKAGEEQEFEAEKKGNKFSFFSKLSKKTSTYMHQLLNTSEDEKKGLAPMKWEHFLKVCKLWILADWILDSAIGHARDGLHV